MKPRVGIIILAAGLGTRMKSDKAKVLHKVCGKPMIEHVVTTAVDIAGPNVIVVVGHQADTVKQVVGGSFDVRYALQAEQLGTGHAVMCAMPHLPEAVEQVVILCGDVPLIRSATIRQLIRNHDMQKRDVTLLAVHLQDPTGYGRVLCNAAQELVGIVEEADADDDQKAITLINTGIYAVERDFLNDALPRIGSDNAQNEIYLTDIIGIGHQQNKIMGTVVGQDSSEIIGVNSPAELQLAENTMISREREKP
jgi:bifunctional UDP-N-acetylglucosamine pyrophosphorylase/glucosamine-1-phosphate N-acetyltransferase/UDP-N-acetylglucosamine pyrophosphorylase